MEDKALYRPILKKSWAITKNYKNLWFFGLFAALLGLAGEYEILGRAVTYPPKDDQGIIAETINNFILGFQEGAAFEGGFWSNMWSAMMAEPLSLIIPIILLLVTLGITAFVIWLAVISQIGLINNVNLISRNKKTTINSGIDFAVKKFWPILGIDVVLKIILSILFFVWGGLILVLTFKGAAGLLLYYLVFVIFIVIVWIVSFLAKYQVFYILLKQQKIVPALNSSWKLLKTYWLISLEMAFILFVIYIVSLIITGTIVASLMAVPFILPIYFNISLFMAVIISLLVIILSLIISLWITAVLAVFQWSAWTLLFNKLIAPRSTVSSIVRASRSMPNYLFRKK